MKKVLITTLILLLTATAVSYAQIFKPESESTGSNSSTYENSTASSGKESTTDDYGGFFRAPDNPGGRPDSGGGIGQRSPLGDGIRILAICCFIYCLVKIGNGKRESE